MARKSTQPPQATQDLPKVKAINPPECAELPGVGNSHPVVPILLNEPPQHTPQGQCPSKDEDFDVQTCLPVEVPEPLPLQGMSCADSTATPNGNPDLTTRNLPEQSEDPEADDATSLPCPSIAEVTRLLRIQEYQKRKCQQAQSQLRGLRFAVARNTRLLNSFCSVRGTFAECIRSEDKPSFANLHDAFQEACAATDSRPASIELDDPTDAKAPLNYPPSFIDQLSGSSRDTLLDFLGQLRSDGTFIAERLLALSHKELLVLLPENQKGPAQESVFGSPGRGSSRLSKPLGYVVDGQLDQIGGSGFASSLESLICTVRCTGVPTHEEQTRELHVWATVAAKLIIEQKPGSEKFVPALLNMWSGFHAWQGKDGLGQWIAKTLQDGSFLLEQPNKQTFRMRAQGRPEGSAEDEARMEAFYTRAVNSLLDLLGDTSQVSIVPNGATALSKAILRSLSSSPGHQRAFPQFVMARWLLPAFFHEAITLPEAHGLLADHYISDLARQRILREIALRAQKVVLDVAYNWKYGNAVSHEAAVRVNTITRLFEDDDVVPNASQRGPRTQHPATDAPMIAVTASDVLGMVNALYPVRRPSSLSSDRDTLRSGLQSSASSISGFSMFKGANGSDTTLSAPTWSTDSLCSLSGHKPSSDEAVVPGLSGDRVAWEDVESQCLRDACSDLEDAVNRTRGSPAQDISQWAFLTTDSNTYALSTVRQKLQATIGVGGSSEPEVDAVSIVGASSPHDSAIPLVCATAVETLLVAYGRDVDPSMENLSGDHGQTELELYAYLVDTFDDAIRDCHLRSDFVMAHEWFEASQSLESLVESLGSAILTTLVRNIEQRTQIHVTNCLSLTNACNKSAESLKVHCDETGAKIAISRYEGNRLRDKMWYVADVRTSGAYDEVRCIAAALRGMGKPKRPSRTAVAPPLRHWTGPKLSSQNMHLKTESQILELLSAAPKHGGPNKLSDEQARSVSTWLDTERIENFCQGEERLHKLCMELRKCVDSLIPTRPTDSPVIASTVLFSRERTATLSSQTPQKPVRTPLFQTPRRFNELTVQTGVPQSIDAVSSASHTLSSASSREYFDHRSPTLTMKSSATFWSPAVTEAQSPSSATSMASYPAVSGLPASTASKAIGSGTKNASAFDMLRQMTVSLLLSDLGVGLFADGCETDNFFWQGIGGQLFDLHIASEDSGQPVGKPSTDDAKDGERQRAFDYDGAFARILARFSASTDPYAKLACLLEVDALLQPYMASRKEADGRGGTARSDLKQHVQAKSKDRSNTANVKVSGFKELFKQQTLRPTALFRDLQFIASLVPIHILETSRQGQAFCHAGLAATQLKNEARTLFVETADSIIAHHTSNRGHASAAQQLRDTAAFHPTTPSLPIPPPNHHSLTTASTLLQIAAREHSPVAQRELATLYLTHPDLMTHITAPFALSSDVFKEELEGKWRRDRDPMRCDPRTMCVAHHWMSLSAAGGDPLAREFLRQREEMERLP
ncbi:hypothetical protein MBLNU230_g4782t1 [Neophaeotheca triangularis]